MWNDWHSDVRKSAAQCLGKTSHGKEVHDDLKERLTIDNEEIRLEAINKIGQLGNDRFERGDEEFNMKYVMK